MKWFKHFTDGHKSEGLAILKAKMGWEWIGRWYILLELVAEKMDGSDRCHLEYPVAEWCRKLECRPQKFSSFLVELELNCHCKIERNEEIIRISIPNLLKKMDEYSLGVWRKSRHVSGESHTQTKTEIQTKREDKNPPTPLSGGEAVDNSKPPAKDHRAETERLINNLVATKKVEPVRAQPKSGSLAAEVVEKALAICTTAHVTEKDKARVFAVCKTIAVKHGAAVLDRINGNLKESLVTNNIANPLALAFHMLNETARAPT